MSESTPEPASDSGAAEPAVPAAYDPEPAELKMVSIRASRYTDDLVTFDQVIEERRGPTFDRK